MDKGLLEKAKELAQQGYSINIDEAWGMNRDSRFFATTPELYGCMALGKDIEEAKENLRRARVDYIFYLLVDGKEVPKPSNPSEWIGKQSQTVPGHSLACVDCNTPYLEEEVNLTLSGQQWNVICPENRILCANCICKRVKKHGGTKILAWIEKL